MQRFWRKARALRRSTSLQVWLPAVLALSALGAAPQAQASGLWDYLQKYQLGVDYTSSFDSVEASYETAATSDPPPQDCELDEDDASRQRCTVHMSGGATSGFGVFLQQAFKRQGLFHFSADVGFGARYLNGELSGDDRIRSAAAGLPLRNLRFSLAALVVKPYITVGITPAQKWPDILLSIGPAAQVALGRVVLNDQAERVAMATSSSGLIDGFFELEIVLWRFGDGALSLFHSSDVTRGGHGAKFYPKEVDGMSDVRADFARSVAGGFLGLGAKLVLDWP
jgi:hypothetical protein